MNPNAAADVRPGKKPWSEYALLAAFFCIANLGAVAQCSVEIRDIVSKLILSF